MQTLVKEFISANECPVLLEMLGMTGKHGLYDLTIIFTCLIRRETPAVPSDAWNGKAFPQQITDVQELR